MCEEVDARAQQLLSYAESNVVHVKQKRFIDEIKSCEGTCLYQLSKESLADFNVNESNLNQFVFKSFCFVVSVDELGPSLPLLNQLDSHFGYLIIVDKFLSPESIAAYKQLLRHCKYEPLSPINRLFEIDYEVRKVP
jgi:hypothetical protein